MRETILLAPGADEKEILRTMAANGKNTIGVRIFNKEKLAEEALLRSGILTFGKKMTSMEKQCLIFRLMKETSYFESASFSDGKNMESALNTAFGLLVEDEEAGMKRVFEDGEFPEKNKAILSIYQAYREEMRKEGCIDDWHVVRLAIAKAEPMNADFVVLNEFPLNPLEEALVHKLSAGKAAQMSFYEFTGKKGKPFEGITFDESYGSLNEIENILGTILKEKIPYDTCNVVIADPAYSSLFLTESVLYDIPMTFGCGISIRDTNAAKLFTLLKHWDTDGYHGVDALKEVIQSSSFDANKFFTIIGAGEADGVQRGKLVEAAGLLKLSMHYDEQILKDYFSVLTNQKEIELYPCLEAFAKEFALGYSYLLENYTVIRSGKEGLIDQSGIRTLSEGIKQYLELVPGGTIEQAAEDLLNKTICREASKEGALHITTLRNALSLGRTHLFVAGLGARLFPGSPSENYLLLDSDYARFGVENVPDSVGVIRQNVRSLYDLLENASAFGTKIHLSYTGFNMKDMKEENPSSILFEIYRREHGADASMDAFNAGILHHVYFDAKFSRVNPLGKAYLEHRLKAPEEKEELITTSVDIQNRPFSPSAISMFFECPRRFYLTRILKIQEPDEDDPFALMKGADPGLLIHELMDELAKNAGMSKEMFMEKAGKKFDDFLKRRVPLHKEWVNRERNEFLRMAETGYRTDPGYHVLTAEVKQSPVLHEDSGVLIYGIPDRVEQREDGENLIVDYKTYSTVKNLEDDIETCLQVVMYAYIMEQKGTPISYCEYRYLKNERQIRCIYNDGMKQQLTNRLREFRQALDEGKFPLTENEDSCRYCKLKMVCGKGERTEGEDEENE